MVAVRGAPNCPCMTVSGKRAPTVKMCESNEQYVPLNDGWNWKGDPNASLSGQDIPQGPPGTPPAGPEAAPAAGPPVAPPPLTVTEYDPGTGSYAGPDGENYNQSKLAANRPSQTWQDMMMPPGAR